MFKIANVPIVEYESFDQFVPDIGIRILDTIKNPPHPDFPNLEFGPPHPLIKKNREFRFRFDDTTDESNPNKLTDKDAAKLFAILRYAVIHNKNVLVHCVMGKCRSGAVTHAGMVIAQYFGKEILAYDNHAIPNSLVKSKIIRRMWG